MRKIQFQDVEGNKIELSPSSAAGLQCFWLSFEFLNGDHSILDNVSGKKIPAMVHLSLTQLAMLRNACDDMIEAFQE